MNCLNCNNPVINDPRKPGPKRIKYCSDKCCWTFRNLKKIENRSRLKSCGICNDEFTDNSRANNCKICETCFEFRTEAYKYNIPGSVIKELKKITKCEICQSTETLCLDHDHATGKARGRLCRLCNAALGSFQDSKELLQSAIDYLRRSNEAPD